MEILRPSARGPAVELLQLGLERAGFPPGGIDGIFGAATRSSLISFQKAGGLSPDGVAGAQIWRALSPWLYGYRRIRLQPGDSFWQLAGRYSSSVSAIETANPGLDPFNLQVGTEIIVPCGFPVVPQNVTFSSDLLAFCVEGLRARYPFLTVGQIGRSRMGKPLHLLRLGRGGHRVLYNGAHHGNEWLTSLLLLLFVEEYCRAYAAGDSVGGLPAEQLFNRASIWIVPTVNPDGADLAASYLRSGPYFEQAKRYAANYPNIAFPEGWKANIAGVDLNLQYPAGWEEAKSIKSAQGYTSPGPRDFVGAAPLSQPESRAMFDFTRSLDPALTLSFHSQGRVIYWKYLDLEPPRSEQIAALFGRLSGYAVEDTPYASGFAGYKDWFIQEYNRPGYTIEVGLGENPLPLSQLPGIYEENVGILARGAVAGL